MKNFKLCQDFLKFLFPFIYNIALEKKHILKCTIIIKISSQLLMAKIAYSGVSAFWNESLYGKRTDSQEREMLPWSKTESLLRISTGHWETWNICFPWFLWHFFLILLELSWYFNILSFHIKMFAYGFSQKSETLISWG